MTNRQANHRFRPLGTVAAVGVALLLGGCAATANPRDPFEKFNRTMFNFNDKIDTVALKPVATVYKEVTPSFLQTGVNNFFGNLSDLWSSVNNFAQLKGQDGLNDFTRFALNSTLGFAGVLDIATPAGLKKHNEDLGQTLGYWGVPSGPYLMLPLLGPSTVRDTAALPGDFWGDPWTHVYPVTDRTAGVVVRAVDQRASVLDASNLLEDAALDRYEFIRDGYLQRRSSRVLDTDRAQERADKVHEKLEKVQEKVEQKFGVKLLPKVDDGADTPAPTPAAPDAPPAAPAKPVSSEPASK